MSEFERLVERLKTRLGERPAELPLEGSRQRAAVAIVLRAHMGAAELLIIKRALSERDHWSGHLALPGGRWETGDKDLSATAARETFEEVGINLLEDGEFLGGLRPVTPGSPLVPPITVAPFISIAPAGYHISAQAKAVRPLMLSDEIQSAFWLPVEFLKKSGRSDSFSLVIGEVERRWPAYPSEQGPIWGLTERILTDFLELLD